MVRDEKEIAQTATMIQVVKWDPLILETPKYQKHLTTGDIQD